MTSFQTDLDVLTAHVPTQLLRSADGRAQVAVVGAYQGRVMTSTATGTDGHSFGWVNRELIASGEHCEHMHPYGGEDRLWLGPEGGQFGLYFAPGVPFDLEHAYVPAAIDTMPFNVVSHDDSSARYAAEFELSNRSGTTFRIGAERDVELLTTAAAWEQLGVAADAGVELVGYQTTSTLINAGDSAWQADSGLLSVWILGMMNAGERTTVIMPVRDAKAANVVNDAYFGSPGDERLRLDQDRNLLFFRGDSHSRGKIGLGPDQAMPVIGSYDPDSNSLTVVQYSRPESDQPYVNSMWEEQDEPYAGDVVNAYNDGPGDPTSTDQLGAFYELESSSPALALAPGARHSHIHRTIHLTAPAGSTALDAVALALFGVDTATIAAALA
ncbi:MAG: DUF6786 family protein [Planctomycetota bacterium]|jgi:hypothetical protein